MIIKRVGGKSKISKWIKNNLPPYKVFVDVFGGSGAVLDEVVPRTNTTKRYIFNDLDSRIYTFFKVLQHRGQDLADLVQITPYSRKFFEEACDVIYDDEKMHLLDELDQALIFLIVNRQSFGSRMVPPWSIAREGEIVYQTWNKLHESVMEIHNKWRNVFLENLDYKELVKKWDGKATLFYCDPPYQGVEHDYYEVNKKEGFNHQEMFDLLQGIEGSCAVSYYKDSDIVDKYVQAGYNMETKNVAMHLAKCDVKPIKTEALLIKYNNWTKQNKNIFE